MIDDQEPDASPLPCTSSLGVENYAERRDYADPGKPKITWNDEQARNAWVTGAFSRCGRCSARHTELHVCDGVQE